MESKLGILIDKLHDLREQKRSLNDKEKEINAQYDEIEREIIKILQDQNLDRCDGSKASATLKIDRYPQVQDKEKFYRWVVENSRYEFVQARVNAGPVREMLDNENLLPIGVDVFQKEKLNLRSKSNG